MEEYRVDVKVRNNIILQKIEKAGYSSVGEFCRLNNLMNICSNLGEIINMKKSPLNFRGDFHPFLEKTADILGCAAIDFFTDTQLHTILKTNKRSLAVNEAEMKVMLEQHSQVKLLEDIVADEQRNKLVVKMLDTLPIREKTIIEMRMGLGEFTREHTLKECSDFFGISVQRARDLEGRAFRRMRHPERHCEVKELYEGIVV